MPAEDTEGLEPLLEYLKRTRGFDFTAYKRPSLARRIQRRMQTVGVETFPSYLDFLEVHPGEFPQLFNTILINVTAFFRDPAPWQYLANEILPRILRRKRASDTIRVWSAGCASGEEAYSLAMLLREALDENEYQERVKIYASNVDEVALAKARQATYSEREVEGVSPELLKKYFEPVDGQFVFRKDIRRSVIFGRHDLIQEAPISRVDLLVCRNTLMYFHAEAQTKVLARFHFALNEGAFLFLGKAEMLLNHSQSFAPVDVKCRVFVKAGQGNIRDRLLLLADSGREEAAANNLASHLQLRDAALDTDVAAQIVFDAGNNLVLANEPARQLLSIGSRDLGRPISELEVAYKPIDIRSHLAQAQTERRMIVLRGAQMPNGLGEACILDVRIIPLVDNGNVSLGVKVVFDDVTHERQTEEGMLQLRQDLETMREELETTNEELESTNEELETTNEELQSTNEELETMNEELQSSNEELRTMNEEIIRRGDELNQVNAFLESIVGSLPGGVIVADNNLLVQVWNDKAKDLWGLRADEVSDKPLSNLDIGLPLDSLRAPIRSCLNGETPHQDLVLEATNRRGKKIHCRVTLTPLLGAEKATKGVILHMEEVPAPI